MIFDIFQSFFACVKVKTLEFKRIANFLRRCHVTLSFPVRPRENLACSPDLQQHEKIKFRGQRGQVFLSVDEVLPRARL